MTFSAELAILPRGNQDHASRHSNFVACAELVRYRERSVSPMGWVRQVTGHAGFVTGGNVAEFEAAVWNAPSQVQGSLTPMVM